MANQLVKLLTNDDGDSYDDPRWHLIDYNGSDPATFCSGEFFGYGQSGCDYDIKVVKRGGITCESCLEKIKDIKAVKL